MGGHLYFVARTEAEGIELWRTDGTAAGTQLVHDIQPGPGHGVPWVGASLTAFGGRVYLQADDGVTGMELWSSDGTSAGTSLVRDLHPGPSGSYPRDLGVLADGSRLLLLADDGVHGDEPWVTDGTSAGTQLLVDLTAGAGDSLIGRFVSAGGQTFFAGGTVSGASELWTTDGTPAGTQVVKELDPSPTAGALAADHFAGNAIAFQGKLYFPVDGGPVRRGLWVSDGTPAGTQPIFTVAGDAMDTARDPVELAGELYVSCSTDATGHELWKLVGSSLELVVDLVPGPGDGIDGDGYRAFGGKLLFRNSSAGLGDELFASDGTAAGTGLLLDIDPGPGSGGPAWLTPLSPTQLLFQATEPGTGTELWTTDGTAAGTQLLADLETSTTTETSDAGRLHVTGNDSFVFWADDGIHGIEPWGWSAAAGPVLLADASPGPGPSYPAHFTSAWLGDQALTFFVADSWGEGKELWRTDGTPGGTFLVADLSPGNQDGVRGGLLPFADHVYFLGTSGLGGLGIWRSDGSPGGVGLVQALPGGDLTTYDTEWVVVGRLAYFAADDGTHGAELWALDLDTQVASLVHDLEPSGDSRPRDLTRFGDRLAFRAYTTALGEELWLTDGTAAGTSVIVDANPGTGGSSPDRPVTLGDDLLFRVTTPATGGELWSYDGVSASLLLDLDPGPDSSWPSNLLEAVGKVFFNADDGVHGRELWTTDGTAAGTQLVADLWPGSTGGLINYASSTRPLYTATSDGIYFTARDGVIGEELYVSDGTAAGTTLVCDSQPGSWSGRPLELTLVGDRLFATGVFQDFATSSSSFSTSAP